VPIEACTNFGVVRKQERDQRLRRGGRHNEPIEDGNCGGTFVPYIGQRTGGSSSLYGMVHERRLARDFEGWLVTIRSSHLGKKRLRICFEVSGSPDPLNPGSATALRSPRFGPMPVFGTETGRAWGTCAVRRYIVGGSFLRPVEASTRR
jgi:hypothetical protein